MITSKTPLRISFFGGGTDIPSFYKKSGYGAVVSSSIDKYIYVTVKAHCKLYPERIRLNYSDTEQVQDVASIRNPILRECLKFLKIDEPLYISTIADAPGSSGLGSSSAFCVGLLNALHAFKGQAVGRGRLAEEAAHIEIDILGRPIGKQDHYAAAFGGLNYFRFDCDGSVRVVPISGDHRIPESLFSNLVTFWTGIQRESSTVLAHQKKNLDRNIRTLSAIREQAEEFVGLLKVGQFDEKRFGEMLDQGWRLKKKLSDKISGPSISDAYNIALACGAIGGKISGAGGGGFLSLVTPEEKKAALICELRELGLVYFPVTAESQGTTLLFVG